MSWLIDELSELVDTCKAPSSSGTLLVNDADMTKEASTGSAAVRSVLPAEIAVGSPVFSGSACVNASDAELINVHLVVF